MNQVAVQYSGPFSDNINNNDENDVGNININNDKGNNGQGLMPERPLAYDML